MLCRKMSTQDVVKEIIDAWKWSEYTFEVDKSLKDYSPHPEELEAKSLFVGLAWNEVPGDVLTLDFPNPLLIGTIAIRYYMPAFMIFSLQNPEDFALQERLADGLLRVPKRRHSVDSFSERFNELSFNQKQSVAAFMRHVALAYGEDTRVRRRIMHSIIQFWDRDGSLQPSRTF